MARCSMHFTPRHIDHVIASVVNIMVQRKQFSLVVDVLVMWCVYSSHGIAFSC